MRTRPSPNPDLFAFTLEELERPGTQGFLAQLEQAACFGRDQGMSVDEIYSKFLPLIKGTMTKHEIRCLIDPACAFFPDMEADEEAINEPLPDTTTYKEEEVQAPRPEAINDEIAKLEERLRTPGIDNDEMEWLLQEIRFHKLIQRTENVSHLLIETPLEPDQIFTDTFDKGDKLVIIASPKMKKSLFLLDFTIHLAAGLDFLHWKVAKPRRVVLLNLEIQANHFHKRVLSICNSIGIHPDDLGDRLHVINCRGLGIEGPEGVELIARAVEAYEPEVVTIDPLYKIQGGPENDIESGKKILSGFDSFIARTGAALCYVHHDAKGNSGDRNTVDRGAGSNIISRDYDACITLTPHATDKSAIVIDTMLRNYKPQEPFTAVFVEDEDGGYHFEERGDITPEKKTSKTRTPVTALSAFLPAAISILGGNEMEMGPFKALFKEKTGLSNDRIKDFINWAISGGKPFLSTREERARGLYRKLIKVVGDVGNGQ